MKMDFLYSARLLVLDFGHPMSYKTIKNIKLSLQNVLTLASSLPSTRMLMFGISVMNSRFTLIQSSNLLRKNYKLLSKKLDNLDKNVRMFFPHRLNLLKRLKRKVLNNEIRILFKPMINSKVTIQDYKRLLSDSIKMAFHEFELKLKEMDRVEDKREFFRKIKSLKVTIITRKTASLLGEIMIDVINKSLKDYFFDSNSVLMKKFQIIHVLAEQEQTKSPSLQRSSNLFDWIVCPHTMHDLECIFKDWFLRPDRERETLLLTLSKNSELIIKCDINDCILDSSLLPFGQTFELRKNFFFEPPVNNQQAEKIGLTSNLEILNRIPLSGVCPTMIFGTPRRIHATQSHFLTSDEFLNNIQIFRELCRKLYQTEQGLLAKPDLETETTQVNVYFFLTSDGNSLLINNVAPTELYLSKSLDFLKNQIQIDQSTCFIVENCLQNIKLLEEYSPSRFSSGVYQYLKRYLNRPANKSNFKDLNKKSKLTMNKKKLFPGHSDSGTNLLLFGGESSKKTTQSAEYKIEAEDTIKKKSLRTESQPKKKQKLAGNLENTNIHPALLSPKILGKHHIYSPDFDFLELDEAFN